MAELWFRNNAGTIFSLLTLTGLLVPVIVGWNKVARETNATIILCRYLQATPEWVVVLLSFIVFLAGFWCVYSTYSCIRVVPLCLVLILVLSYWGLGATMQDNLFKYHVVPTVGICISQLGLVLLMAPSRWKIALVSVIPFVFAGIFGNLRNTKKNNDYVELIYTYSSWMIASMIPLAFFMAQDKHVQYVETINRYAIVLDLVLLLLAFVMGFYIAAQIKEDG